MASKKQTFKNYKLNRSVIDSINQLDDNSSEYLVDRQFIERVDWALMVPQMAPDSPKGGDGILGWIAVYKFFKTIWELEYAYHMNEEFRHWHGGIHVALVDHGEALERLRAHKHLAQHVLGFLTHEEIIYQIPTETPGDLPKITYGPGKYWTQFLQFLVWEGEVIRRAEAAHKAAHEGLGND